jgi:hypothetical protein
MKTARFRTTASMTSGSFFTRDALLSTPTPAESAANAKRVAELTGLELGQIWNGIWQTPSAAAAFDALPADVQGALLEKYGAKAQTLADYARMSSASSPLTSVTTITDNRSQARDGASAAAAMRSLIQDINAANAAQAAARPVSSAPRPGNATQATVRSINDQNRKFWEERTRR